MSWYGIVQIANELNRMRAAYKVEITARSIQNEKSDFKAEEPRQTAITGPDSE